ncbi:MAG: hypothetical protein KJO07_11060 [Deltaproteobacteria bacterium]|nr:hypothetical protein [Deltaproteobacteria bacterium]
MRRSTLAASLLFLAIACKSGGDGGKGEPTVARADESPGTDAAANKPRGWKAYPEQRVTSTEGMSAADAELVGHDGKKLQLSTTWADGYAVVVFYRGHW